MTDAATPQRIIALWFPDWPVYAHLDAFGVELTDPLPPLALVAKRMIVACSPAARARGVRIGLREQEARLRCPDLAIEPLHPTLGSERFATLLAAFADLIPHIAEERPGLAVMQARGPARFYGSELQAAQELRTHATTLGYVTARIGIAEGRFAAEQTARADTQNTFLEAAEDGIRVLSPGTAKAFLAPLPVDLAIAGSPRLSDTLHGLGIHTLGAFAALPEPAVRARFGPGGVTAHRRAQGLEPASQAAIQAYAAAQTFEVTQDFETPIDTAEQLAFACSALANTSIDQLAQANLVCTEFRITLIDDIGMLHERVWGHPQYFSAADLLTRIRWQSEQVPRAPERTGSGIARIMVFPVRTDAAAAHEPGLWNTGADERVHHQFSRVQQLLGPSSIGTFSLTGGRLVSERQSFTPWGTVQADASRNNAAAPWPGALIELHPSLVFDPPRPAQLLGTDGTPLFVTPDDVLSADPAEFSTDPQHSTQVAHWSLPWPLRERWWESRPVRHRLQVELADGTAWLLITSNQSWFAEGKYD
ncbi:DNA polymerase Y family protein [Leucobacter sp. cx-42]|uniref:DNA polymerase Y family protein n=1 Tax=unclassified Leucobacter TaxID=2621730 RepID=UPI00165E2A90|nr:MULTISPECIES: DNA polymerase Y family protein [unclassified Leucobacter]MBC9955202.1 DNA polymerase Y family protein [Leucobacter sp. cx-42]